MPGVGLKGTGVGMRAVRPGGEGPPPPAPSANFTGTPLSGYAPLAVAFTDRSTRGPTSWLWEKNGGGGWAPFDGTPAVRHPTETFAAGTWSVRLTASNAQGDDGLAREDYVAAAALPDPPEAAFSGDPLSGEESVEVAFTDESTGEIDSWSWEKNDGSGWVPFGGTPALQNPTETFGEGLWSVRLTVTNAGGGDGEEKADYVAVEPPPPPVADFTADPTTGDAPLAVTFTDTSTESPTTWLWEKNDGSGWVPFDGTPAVANPVESFGVGTWSVRLTVTNAGGSDDEEKADFLAAAEPPPPEPVVTALFALPGDLTGFGQGGVHLDAAVDGVVDSVNVYGSGPSGGGGWEFLAPAVTAFPVESPATFAVLEFGPWVFKLVNVVGGVEVGAGTVSDPVVVPAEE